MSYEQNLLADNERIAFSTRQHWIVILGSAAINVVPAVVLGVLVVFFSVMAGPWLLLLLIPLVFPLARFVLRVLKWWNERYIITSRRVIQAEGMVTKRVIDPSLEKVNDVVLVQSIWGRLLGYGDVDILTASEFGVNRLERIADPVGFKTQMLAQKEAMRGGDWPEPEEEVPAADIPDLIAELDELRDQGIISDQEFEQKKKILLDRI